MGRAAIDLPNPKDKSAGAAPGSADDLLSQLAGEEIDRLLAEADTRPGDAATPAGPSLPGDPSQLEELFNPLPASGTHSKESSPSASVSTATLELPTPSPAASEPRAPISPPIDSVPNSPAAEPMPVGPGAATIDQPTSAAERAALAPPAEIHDPPSADRACATATDDLSDDLPPRPSVLLRGLELLNAPFNACPDVIRDLLGKLAILTAMNALGVLIYVLLFRHR